MQDFLKGIKNLGTKAKSTIKDFFTVTPEEEANGKAPNVIEKTTKTVGDFFAPKADTVRVRDVVREVPGATADVAKEVAKGAARFALSAGESLVDIPLGINELINPSTKYKVPIYEPEKIPGLGFLGPIESYQNQAKREMAKGESGGIKSFLKTAGNVAIDEPIGVAFKPLGLAFGAMIRGGGGKAVEEAIQSLAKTNAPEEIKTLLGSLGIGKKAAGELAEPLAKAGTVDEVKALLGYTDNVAPKATKTAEKAVSRETEPLYTTDKDTQKKGIKMLEKAFGDKQGALDHSNDFWAREGEPGVFYHATSETSPFAFEKSKAANYDVGTRAGISNVNGLYVGRDKTALDNFYNIAAERGENMIKFEGNPKLLDLTNEDAMIKFTDKYKTGDEIEKAVSEMGYDGIKYFDPFATGEEIVITNTKALRPVEFNGKPIKAPRTASNPKKTVARETPESVDSMRSIGDILKGKGGDIVPPAKPIAKGGKAPKGDPERRFITRTREMAPEVDELLEGKYKPKSNKELIANAEKMIADDYAGAEKLARTGTDDQAVAIANKLIEDELNIARKATDEATKNKAYALAAEIANDAAKNLTEAGRAVQAASLLGKMTPEGMARYAARQIQKYNEGLAKGTITNFLGRKKPIPELTKDQIKEVADAIEAINKMEDGIEKARALDMLGKKISMWIPSSLYDQVIGVWKAGLLTGLKTTGINISSNAMHGITEVVKDIPGSLVDIVVQKLFTGKRALTMPSPLQAKQMYKGTGEGLKKGWDFLKTGFDERNIASKLDYRRVNYGKTKAGKAMQAYVDAVFRLLGAEDQPFYYAARARSLGNQAEAMAINEGLKGKAARDFAQKLIENPTDDMLKYSIVDAETAVFQHDSAIARAANTMKKGLSEVVIPFAKTPGNVADQMINYTPVGPVKEIISQIKKGKFDQRTFSQAMGRGITGTGALAIGSALMANKMMNLGMPSSEKERKQWELEGRVPNSILIGGKWRNVGVTGTLGMTMIIGGHYRKGLEETGSPAGALVQAGLGGLSALTEQSFLSGVNRFVDALKDPERSLEGFASGLAGSIIPTIIADIARGTDQYERRTDGMIERIQSRIPGARQALEPQVDTLGNTKETPNFLEVMADATRPGNPSADISDPVVHELKRLYERGYISTPTQIVPKNGYKNLTDEQNTYVMELSGRYAKDAIEKVITDPNYKSLDNEEKADKINKAVTESKIESRAKALVRITKGLSDAETDIKIYQLKDEGMATNQVIRKYESLIKN